MAAWVLSDSGEADDQDVVARALMEAVPMDADVPAAGHTRLFLSWSLAATVARRGDATPAALRALIHTATAPAPLPYAAWNFVRTNALRGIIALPADPRARAALAEIARGDCRYPMAALPTAFRTVSESDLDANAYNPPCWARAALANASSSVHDAAVDAFTGGATPDAALVGAPAGSS